MRDPILRIVRFLIPTWARGQSWGHLVLVHRVMFLPEHQHWLRRLVSHELVHYDQWKRYGWIGFPTRYVWGWVSNGFRYLHNPLELEAWVKESDDEYLLRADLLLGHRNIPP